MLPDSCFLPPLLLLLLLLPFASLLMAPTPVPHSLLYNVCRQAGDSTGSLVQEECADHTGQVPPLHLAAQRHAHGGSLPVLLYLF